MVLNIGFTEKKGIETLKHLKDIKECLTVLINKVDTLADMVRYDGHSIVGSLEHVLFLLGVSVKELEKTMTALKASMNGKKDFSELERKKNKLAEKIAQVFQVIDQRANQLSIPPKISFNGKKTNLTLEKIFLIEQKIRKIRGLPNIPYPF